MVTTGTFRIYFNRHGAAPLTWCVHNGAWEIAVSEVRVVGVCRTVYKQKAAADEDDGIPSGWIEAQGKLKISGSIATIGEP